MAKKMYYTQREATEALGISAAELEAYVRDGKLRIFMDGIHKMFKTEQVDALAGGAAEEVQLTPAQEQVDTMAQTEPMPADAVTLDEAGTAEASKEDTVITSEGISIFDEEDLEIETADPLAKTQVAPALEDQIALEGVGSGSGLLDLTRESDDTSLGAELLDGIDMEGAPSSGLAAGVEVGAVPLPAGAEEIIEEPAFVEAIDRNVGLFQGFLIGTGILGFIAAGVMLAAMVGRVPEYLGWLHQNMMVVVIGGVVFVGVVGLIGWLVGRTSADRKLAIMQAGG